MQNPSAWLPNGAGRKGGEAVRRTPVRLKKVSPMSTASFEAGMNDEWHKHRANAELRLKRAELL